MNTYLQNTATADIFCLRGVSPAAAKKMINRGDIVGYSIVKATARLRESARLNIEVRCVRVLYNGRLGYL